MRICGILMSGFAASALLSLGVLVVPGAALAQPGYYDDAGRWHDGCGGSTVAGALVGGGVGAVAGSQIASHGHRTDGSIVGGVLGALAGSAIANNGCEKTPPPPPPPPPPGSYIPPDTAYPQQGYAPPPYPSQGYPRPGYGPQGYDQPNGYRPPADYNPEGALPPPPGYGGQAYWQQPGYASPSDYDDGEYDHSPPPPPGGYYAEYGPDAPPPPPPPAGYTLGPVVYGPAPPGVLVLGGPRFRYFYYPRHYRWSRYEERRW